MSTRKTGDKIVASDMVTATECKELVAVYPISERFDEDGNRVYEISDNPDGKLLLYRENGYDELSAIYFKNDMETSCLVDLF